MKKSILFLILIQFILMPLCALPGAKLFIPDMPGEYVYYEDFSFNRKSYIGFLTYDQSTFAVRYYAPATKDKPEKNVELLFTIDSSKDYIDMTGERFVTSLLPEDTDIVNYIHDLIYEFSARRKKVGEISPAVKKDASLNPFVTYSSMPKYMESGFIHKETFDQFGGQVNVFYDYLLPIFNIKKIETEDGKPLFKAVAYGMLKSSDDRSFSEFKIIEKSNSAKVHKVNAKAKKYYKIEYGKTELTLDENWSKAGKVENIYFCGDSAMIQIHTSNISQADLVIKSMIRSTASSYIPLESVEISESENKIICYGNIYDGENNFKFVNTIMKKNKKLAKSEIALLLLNVSLQDYLKNKKYFEKVLETWK